MTSLPSKEGILKNGQSVFLVQTMKVNRVKSCLDHTIIQNISFCVPQKKESHSG